MVLKIAHIFNAPFSKGDDMCVHGVGGSRVGVGEETAVKIAPI